MQSCTKKIIVVHIAILVIISFIGVSLSFARVEKKQHNQPAEPDNPFTCKIINPQPDRVYYSGRQITINVDAESKPPVSEVILIYPPYTETLDNYPFEKDVIIPKDFVGTFVIGAVAMNDEGQMKTDEINIQVKKKERLVKLSSPQEMSLNAEKTNIYIPITGTYEDGALVDLHASELGTTYESTEPEIATVNSEGRVTAKSDGMATVIIRNGELYSKTYIIVTKNS